MIRVVRTFSEIHIQKIGNSYSLILHISIFTQSTPFPTMNLFMYSESYITRAQEEYISYSNYSTQQHDDDANSLMMHWGGKGSLGLCQTLGVLYIRKAESIFHNFTKTQMPNFFIREQEQEIMTLGFQFLLLLLER